MTERVALRPAPVPRAGGAPLAAIDPQGLAAHAAR